MKRLAITLFTTLVACLSFGFPAKPVPARFVADFANIFEDNKEAELANYLTWVSDSCGIQIQVVTTLDLEDETPATYAMRIGEEWGVGDSKKNNGLVILIKPRTDTKGEVFIATGYGTETLLTDAKCQAIIGQYMIDYLVEGDYYSAAEAGAHACANIIITGNDELIDQNDDYDDDGGWTLWGLLGVLLLIFLLRAAYVKSPGYQAKKAIHNATNKAELDAAVEAAEKLGFSNNKMERALEHMRKNRYAAIQNAASPAIQAALIAAAADMLLDEDKVKAIVAKMPQLTLQDYKNCRSTSELDAKMQRAIAFGNDEAAMRALYSKLMSLAAAAEAAAARASRSSSGGGGGHHSSYGGGHFGGGGAGRSF